MSFGVKVYRLDAPPYQLDSNSIIMNLSGQTVTSAESGSTGITIPTDHNNHIILCTFPVNIKTAEYTEWDTNGNATSHTTTYTVTAVQFSGTKSISYSNNTSQNNQISAFSWATIATTPYQWGIKFYGNNSISYVNTNFERMYVAWKGELTIPAEGFSFYELDGRLNNNNSIFTYYTEDTSVFLGWTKKKTGGYTFTVCPYDVSTGEESTSSITVKMVVFSYLNIRVNNQPSTWGIRISNPSGNEVFNTDQEVLINPRIISPSEIIGRTKQFEGITRPLITMYPVSVAVKNDNGYVYTPSISGTGVTARESVYTKKKDVVNNGISATSTNNIMVLNADDYFSFVGFTFWFSAKYAIAPVSQKTLIFSYSTSASASQYEIYVPHINKDYVDIDKTNKTITARRNGLCLQYSILAIETGTEAVVGKIEIEFRIDSEMPLREVEFNPSVGYVPFDLENKDQWYYCTYKVYPENTTDTYTFKYPSNVSDSVRINQASKRIEMKFVDSVNYFAVQAINEANQMVGNFSVTMGSYFRIKLLDEDNHGDGMFSISVFVKQAEDGEYVRIYTGTRRTNEDVIIDFMDGAQVTVRSGRTFPEFSPNDGKSRIKEFRFFPFRQLNVKLYGDYNSPNPDENGNIYGE